MFNHKPYEILSEIKSSITCSIISHMNRYECGKEFEAQCAQ